VSDKTVKVIALSCPELETLDLSWAKISDEAAVSLTRGVCLSIQTLNMTVCVTRLCASENNHTTLVLHVDHRGGLGSNPAALQPYSLLH
jgi:hypothetical protein